MQVKRVTQLAGLLLFSSFLSAPAWAEPIFAVDADNESLVSFDSATPGTVTSIGPITGLASGETIRGIDFRPMTGVLFGLARAGSGGALQLYTIDEGTGAATAVGEPFTPGGGTAGDTGFDFNPTNDFIRVVIGGTGGSNAQNFRVDPDTGTIVDTDTVLPGVQQDGALAYAVGDPNAAANPQVANVAYSNNTADATTTVLYDIDTGLGILATQGGAAGPNDGQLNTVGSLGFTPGTRIGGFDISQESGTAFAALGSAGSSTLYTIALASGTATMVGAIAVTGSVRGIATPATPPVAGAPGSLQFSMAGFSVGEADGNAMITVTRTGGSSGAASAAFATSDGTATAGDDYTATMETVTFADGDAASKTVLVPITDDSDIDPGETVNLALTDATGATLGAPSTATLTIVNNDTDGTTPPVPGTLQFSMAGFSVGEGAGAATLTVTRMGGSDGAASATFATSNGTATAGADYSATTTTVSFADGDDAPKTVSVPILDDTAVEGNETVNLALSGATGATLGTQSTAVLTIIDNDTDDGTPPPPPPGGDTVAVPTGENVAVAVGGVTATFQSVTGAGTLTVTPIDDPSSVGDVSGTPISAFEVTTTTAFTGNIEICFPVSGIDSALVFATLNVFHEEDGELVNRTSSREFSGRTICATVSSLSPFVITQGLSGDGGGGGGGCAISANAPLDPTLPLLLMLGGLYLVRRRLGDKG